MSQYLLSVWHDVDYTTPDPERDQRAMQQVWAFNERLMASGAWVFAGGLHPNSSATVVRADGADISMIDGPYAESKEQMGGFWVIDVPDLDAAPEWAKQGAAACMGPVEVRLFQG